MRLNRFRHHTVHHTVIITTRYDGEYYGPAPVASTYDLKKCAEAVEEAKKATAGIKLAHGQLVAVREGKTKYVTKPG